MTSAKQPTVGVLDTNGIDETRTPISVYCSRDRGMMVGYLDAEGRECVSTLEDYAAWKDEMPDVGPVDFGPFVGPFTGLQDPFPLVEDSRKKLVLKTEAHLVDFLARALNAAWKTTQEAGR